MNAFVDKLRYICGFLGNGRRACAPGYFGRGASPQVGCHRVWIWAHQRRIVGKGRRAMRLDSPDWRITKLSQEHHMGISEMGASAQFAFPYVAQVRHPRVHTCQRSFPSLSTTHLISRTWCHAWHPKEVIRPEMRKSGAAGSTSARHRSTSV